MFSFVFFAMSTKMKTILQSLVKIIIIGSLCEQSFVVCNQQYYPVPPLPYYQNDGYYYSDLPAYGEPSSPYYNIPNVPPPSPNPYANYYVPSQLFQQNENYQPPQGLYPQIPPGEMSYPPPSFSPQQGMMSVDYPQMNPNPTFASNDMSNQRPSNVPQQETKFYNIVEKEKDFQPYYHDEYNKNYHEDDYDNYNDDDQGDPCGISYQYQYYEDSRKNPNFFDGNNLRKYAPCTPHFQPDFRGKIYSFKAPITILPSRFPPRIEEIIERIQNYFSTYTQQQQQQQGSQKPINSSSSSSETTVPSTTITNSESEVSVTSPATDLQQNNEDTTGEIEPSVQTKLDQSEPTVNAVFDVEQVTEKSEVLTTQLDNGISSTTEDSHNAQVNVLQSQNPNSVTEEVSDATETVANVSNEPVERGHNVQTTSTEIQSHPIEVSSTSENPTQKPVVKELDRSLDKTTENSISSESGTVTGATENVVMSTEPTDYENRTEETDYITSTNEVFTTNHS